MDELGLGAGLAALAFWGFVACAVLASTWNGIRKREAQHETVRRLIESGQAIDQRLLEKLLAAGEGGSGRPDRDFKITALWLLPVSVGLVVLAFFLSSLSAKVFYPVAGAGALCACLGVGCLIAARITARWYEGDDDAELGRLDA